MVGGFNTESDNEKIKEMEKTLNDVLDSQLFGQGGNQNLNIDSSHIF